MTTQELNRDIKRLLKMHKAISEMYENPAYYEWREKLIKEYRRLYDADKELKYMNAASIRIMIHLNLTYPAVALNKFGISIDL